MSAGKYYLMVFFLNEWCVWRECQSKQEAIDALQYWKARVSWRLAIKGHY